MAEVTVVSLEERQWKGQAVRETLADPSPRKRYSVPAEAQRDNDRMKPLPSGRGRFPTNLTLLTTCVLPWGPCLLLRSLLPPVSIPCLSLPPSNSSLSFPSFSYLLFFTIYCMTTSVQCPAFS